MTQVSTFCIVAIALAFIMTVVHYAVMWATGNTRPCEPPLAQTGPPNAEIEKFDAAAGARWVADAQSVARRIYDERGEVSTDDVWNEFPPPRGVDGRLASTIFDRNEWEIAGRRVSTRARNSARQIAVWRRKADMRVAA